MVAGYQPVGNKHREDPLLDLNSLSPGSFNGSEFLIEESQVSGGRKVIVHEFPNQDTRYVEDLGLLNETIRITAAIPTASYFAGRDSLKASLESTGYGTLIHPFYGIRSAVCTGYDIDESPSSLGYVKIVMTLVVGQELNFPAGGGSLSGILGAISYVFSVFTSEMDDSYAPETLPANARSTLQGLNTSIVNSFISGTNNYTVREDLDYSALGEFLIAAEEYERDNSLLGPGSEVATRYLELLTKVDSVTLSGTGGFSAASSARQAVNTALGIYQSNFSSEYTMSRTILALMVDVGLVQLMLKNLVVCNFTTVADLDGKVADVTAAYEGIISKIDTVDELSSQVVTRAVKKVVSFAGTRDALTSAFQLSMDKASQDRTRLPYVTYVSWGVHSVTGLTYALYGSLEKDESIRELNRSKYPDTTALDIATAVLTSSA